MSLPYGVLVSTVVSRIRTELQDNSASPRWSDSIILAYLNDGIRDLAKARCFRRKEVLVPTAGRGVYQYLSEPAAVFSVWYDGLRLSPSSIEALARVYGQDWASQSGQPTRFVPDESLRICPIPGSAGTALVTSGSAPITQSEGDGPGGSGYWCFDNSGTNRHFLPGDGTVTNPTASGNLWVDYAYYPAEVQLTEKIAKRWETALINFAAGKCLTKSDDAAEAKDSERLMGMYFKEKENLTVGINSPRFGTNWTPPFPVDANGWEWSGSVGRDSILQG